MGENDGTLKYYQNTGTTSNPAYEAKTGETINPHMMWGFFQTNPSR
ncbi:MAG: hypothetical protein H0A76_09980 [Candidatus Thiodubiliella endoseptemdiera]|uniref:Uncharacterized protein n=1 Tax=Candidatus Thiodubiliella endoseptemdiera TaxID=2738886 RepID=A0A853F951_9GAMM|nr:hypothetical protein [Candidatus Thiodubiliella endoseptemdiera]